MAGFNQIILMGNISRTPQLKYLESQTAVVNFAIASNRTWKDGEGVKHETVVFIDCFMYGKRAEALSKHFKKGDPIHICGSLILDQWKKGDTNYYRHKVKVESWQFIASKAKGGTSDDNNES